MVLSRLKSPLMIVFELLLVAVSYGTPPSGGEDYVQQLIAGM